MVSKKGDLLYDKESQYIENEYYLESDRRDVYYSALVKDIVKNNRSSQRMKVVFFVIVCVIFSGVCAAGMYIMFIAAQKETPSYADIGIALTAFGSVISAIIALPSIIANHLFPANSESVRFGFIRDNQKMDTSYLADDVTEVESNIEMNEIVENGTQTKSAVDNEVPME